MSLDNDRKDLITPEDLGLHEAPSGADRRAFLMRSAAIAAAAVMTGCTTEEKKATVAAATAPASAENLSADLDVGKKSKGPVMTVIDEFYKVGHGPSSSHPNGPVRITSDFSPRRMKLTTAQSTTVT